VTVRWEMHCHDCGVELDWGGDIHYPHEDGCDAGEYGAAICWCDRVVCGDCCPDCNEENR
jgi:hypothetical protein